MPLKCLNDLPALKVPKVYLIVFASRDDPFASRDAEACRDAILLIGMPDVGLQTTGRLIVP